MSLLNNDGDVKNVSIIIPTLNEVLNIKHVFPFIPEFVDEIIVIDGNSTDGTREEILKHKSDANIIIVDSPGKGTALRKGFEIAKGDLIIIMDADGSNDPKELRRLVTPILNGYDVASGSRLMPGGGSADITLMRRFGNFIFVTMVNTLYGTKYTDLCYGYRAFKKEAIERIYLKSNGFEIETEQSILMAKAKLKIKEVPSYESERIHGKTNLRTLRDGFKIFTMIISEYVK